MPVFGEGKCLYGILEKCRLGDKGVEYDPIACLTCAMIYLADSVNLGLVLAEFKRLNKSGQ